jgi:hypothetical protein
MQRTRQPGSNFLVEIDVTLGRRLVRILFGDLQHLIELLAEYLIMRLVALHRLQEGILAPAGFASLPLDGAFQVREGRRLNVFHVPDHGLGFGIDV